MVVWRRGLGTKERRGRGRRLSFRGATSSRPGRQGAVSNAGGRGEGGGSIFKVFSVDFCSPVGGGGGGLIVLFCIENYHLEKLSECYIKVISFSS